jgi:hypothetical protein
MTRKAASQLFAVRLRVGGTSHQSQARVRKDEETMEHQNFSTIFAEIQRWKMTAIAVTPSGQIVSAIGYDGTLKELPRAEDILTLHPNAFIRHLGRNQVRSAAELAEIVREMTATTRPLSLSATKRSF